MGDRHLVDPFRIEQVRPLLRRVFGFDEVGVVAHHRRVRVGDGDLVGRIEIARQRLAFSETLRLERQQQFLLTQRDVLPQIGGREHVAIGDLRLHVLHQTLIEHLAGGAHDVALHIAVERAEQVADPLGRLGAPVADIPGHLAFLLRPLVEVGEIGIGRQGERRSCDHRHCDEHRA